MFKDTICQLNNLMLYLNIKIQIVRKIGGFHIPIVNCPIHLLQHPYATAHLHFLDFLLLPLSNTGHHPEVEVYVRGCT
jgi:hypothetical protein